MKKIIFFLFLTFILSGCSGTDKKLSFTEKDTGINVPTNEADIARRINEINNGATPKVKPTGKSTANNTSNDNQMPAQNEANKINLEDLAKEFNYAIIKTNLGDIKVSFYAAASPLTVNNFLNLAKQGFYNGVKFHRVIRDFMIQSGDPLSKEADKTRYGSGGPGYKFQDEINANKLVKGSLAMANSGPNTNGSQFFIVTKESTPWLDGKHTNFGYVVDGLDVAMKIDSVKTDENDLPLEDIIINSIELQK
jgi:cyclophilin family peptidyl-prolyl cis-trans isomerase